MIPTNLSGDLVESYTTTEQASLTYRIQDEEKIVGKIDDLDAIRQAIAVMLNVERYEHAIYSWQYGVELADLIGTDVAYACPTAAARIKECLLQDERITDVDGWSFAKDRNAVNVTFTVHTLYGDINASKEVII